MAYDLGACHSFGVFLSDFDPPPPPPPHFPPIQSTKFTEQILLAHMLPGLHLRPWPKARATVVFIHPAGCSASTVCIGHFYFTEEYFTEGRTLAPGNTVTWSDISTSYVYLRSSFV